MADRPLKPSLDALLKAAFNYEDPSDFANGLRVVRTIEELADLAAHASALKVKAGARR